MASSTGGKMGAEKIEISLSPVFLPSFFCQPT
jgi:hypothetical protein